MATLVRPKLAIELGLVDQTGTGIRSATGKLSGFSKLVSGAASVAGGVLGAQLVTGLAGAAKGFIFANASAEQYLNSLETVTGSQKAANDLMKDLQAFAASTPFE